MNDKDGFFFGGVPQYSEKKKSVPIAAKTCTVVLETVVVDLVAGQPVRGLTAKEREHLKFHGFIK